MSVPSGSKISSPNASVNAFNPGVPGITTDLKDRPAVRYDVEVNREVAPTKTSAQAEQKETK